MNKNIKELQDFYLLDNKLVYVSKEFVGYDPLISKGLSFEKVESGTKIKLDAFKMGGAAFNAILTYFIARGPLRGYKRVEILKNGRAIINWEYGGMGHGSNYYKGDDYHLENADAFLIKSGYAMRDWTTDKIYSNLNGDNYYFFWFKNVIVPTQHEILSANNEVLTHDKVYSRKEIEPLRQILWSAHITLNSRPLYIKKVGVPNCWQTYGDDEGHEEFQRIDDEGFVGLDEIEFELI